MPWQWVLMVSCRKTIWLFCCNLYPTYSVYLNELYSGTFTTVPTTSLIFLVFVRYKILNFHYMRRNVKSDSWLKCKACTGHPADYTRRRTLLVKTMNTLFIQKRIMVPYRGLTVAEACFYQSHLYARLLHLMHGWCHHQATLLWQIVFWNSNEELHASTGPWFAVVHPAPAYLSSKPCIKVLLIILRQNCLIRFCSLMAWEAVMEWERKWNFPVKSFNSSLVASQAKIVWGRTQSGNRV